MMSWKRIFEFRRTDSRWQSFFFSSRRRHTRFDCDWSSDVCSSDLEWKNIKEGDFVVLDRGSYDPRHEAGIAMLMLGPTPLFNVKIKQNKMELVDYAFRSEERRVGKECRSGWGWDHERIKRREIWCQ